jgi:hypothetical protein
MRLSRRQLVGWFRLWVAAWLISWRRPVMDIAASVTPVAAEDFTSDYEGGNGAAFASVSPTEYDLRGEPDLDPNPPNENTHWATPFDFVVRRGVQRKAITFNIDLEYVDVTAFGGNLTVNHFAPWFTYDLSGRTGWQPILDWSYDGDGEVLSLTTPVLERDWVRIAEFPPYTLANEAEDSATWEASGHCTRLQIGTSVEGRPIYCYRVTADGSHTGKKAMIITGGGSGHEQERPSTWRAKGMLDYLCGDGAGASTLRGRRIVYIVLRNSPDTYVNGRMRVNEAGVELNRWARGDDNGNAAPNLAVDGVEQYAARVFYEDLMAGNGVGGVVPRIYCDCHASAGTLNLSYAPGSTELSTLPIATYDAPGHWCAVTSDSWIDSASAVGKWSSHRVMDRRFSGLAAILTEAALVADEQGTRMTVAIAEAMGVSLIRACDAWLVTN